MVLISLLQTGETSEVPREVSGRAVGRLETEWGPPPLGS